MPRTPKAKPAAIEVDALRHTDTRANIPTSELRDFSQNDEELPVTVLYPRDPSLDPQLVWQGKDEQDSADLRVPAVPIYIQEKIHPQAIIDAVRAHATSTANGGNDADAVQLDLFADFNGIDSFERMIEFYQHQQHWTNRMILGDSLLAMNSLAEKEGLRGQVQMIYFDPPYGIKFGSNWQVSTRKRDVKDGRAEDLVRQPEQVRAFRDTWERGIHSYLAYLRDRLVVARDLLTESGSIFVQIGDENVHLVRNLLDEVFGSENFLALITLWKTSSATTTVLPAVSDYLLWYAKDGKIVKYRQLYTDKTLDDGGSEYRFIETHDALRRSLTRDELQNPDILPIGSRLYRPSPMTSQSASSTTSVPFVFESSNFLPGSGGWKTNERGFSRLVKANRIIKRDKSLSYMRYLNDFPVIPVSNLWLDTRWGFDASERIYVVQTNVRAVQRCLLMTTDPGDLVLDPTMGSGTTAYVAEQWGRRWITIDTSRVALALARTRLMAARFPYYLLQDSAEGARKEAELIGTAFPPRQYTYDVKQGFVYERVPHITLRDIANNEEIDTIYERWQPEVERLRAAVNAALGTSYEDWQMPREAVVGTHNNASVSGVGVVVPASGAGDLLASYWAARRDRQAQIDASIARHSSTETLVDKPYEDKGKVRVTGPFTVETLSPHRVLDPASAERLERARETERTPMMASDVRNAADRAAGEQYRQMILDNLRVAGVQNTVRDQRLTFQTLEPLASAWLHAVGTYTDADGVERRAAVTIGSEHGTVTARQIKQAAIEAVKGIPHDVLLVCGFAFDPAVHEESRRYGSLDVLIVRMNSDLMMGDALKNTDRANLFTIFGEPDLTIETAADGRIVVELRGLDIYDPTRGQIRSSSVDDIAAWFIDTDYNEISFFVRQAYFLGNDSAYDSLKRALRAEVDEAAWSALYSARSMPFARPESGTIAVKVINHYGDEVLKVFRV